MLRTTARLGLIIRRAEHGFEAVRSSLKSGRARSAARREIGLPQLAYSFARCRRSSADEGRRLFCKNAGDGCASMRRVARSMYVPCHHNLDHFLMNRSLTADIAVDATGYLFRKTAPKSGALTEKPMHQQDAYRMIKRRAKAAGIETKIGNHTFRATGLTAYLKNSGNWKWRSTSLSRKIFQPSSPTSRRADRRLPCAFVRLLTNHRPMHTK